MTHHIALIAGPYLLITGLGFLISGDFYKRMIEAQGSADPILINLSGATHLVVGLTVLVNHFRWTNPAEVVVSLVGVAASLKGASLILVPDRMMTSPQMSNGGVVITGIGFCVIGAYLTGVGLYHLS